MACVSPVSAGPGRNGKAPAPAKPWHPHSSSSKTILCALLGRSWGDDPRELNTKLCFTKNAPFFPLFLRKMVSMALGVVLGLAPGQ